MFSQIIIVKPTMMNPSLIISEDIFPRLHMLFVNHGCRFGLSFPAYSFKKHGNLGNIVEVLCEDREALAALNLASEFKDIEDVKVLTGINETEDYILFRRVREKSRIEKYAARFKTRNGEAPENLRGFVQKHNKKVFSNAFITVRSASTGQKYNLFVSPAEGKTNKFNAYGLVSD
ncbi:MAG: type I-F CRISPR-associated endoribonuclease Cas6/Csy4 [Lachnospiraceae bacterium]|nr:type I-F CRISPR-associated endoribonuclease Cas6/Csy4 [Lachnospiraceae bacterium]